jgi:hypothetical protein
MWYLGGLGLWFVVGGFVGGLGQHSNSANILFGIAIVFFYVGWWLPYITWLALGERTLYAKFPDRGGVFYAFAALSLALFLLMVLQLWSESWQLLIFPAAAVTIMYMVRRTWRSTTAESN